MAKTHVFRVTPVGRCWATFLESAWRRRVTGSSDETAVMRASPPSPSSLRVALRKPTLRRNRVLVRQTDGKKELAKVRINRGCLGPVTDSRPSARSGEGRGGRGHQEVVGGAQGVADVIFLGLRDRWDDDGDAIADPGINKSGGLPKGIPQSKGLGEPKRDGLTIRICNAKWIWKG
ncbi:hypothetical protein BDK51DRAFT_34453 [Blyttiomyces helicus]|uniref:Uncharacterized protein n=1 Tax=Blyttiomyces helicus TaxID=388810 RepID=A0A4P9VYE2_9FUNG|nr:hypothetical protein BDK51DRAFT_34453 [Blyttiomyces helicus]|eukprot:RKO83773.1 hypothetical protein BDK51DRAFT_34453 [Blyttiomyces helicus]